MRLHVNHALPLAALILLTGCLSGGGGDDHARLALPANGPAADYPMVLGDPFTIGGVTYAPNDRLNYDAVGYASIGTQGGNAVSLAHKTLPLPSYVEVTALDSGKTILARVERRGPMTNDLVAELSPGAAAQLELSGPGKAAIRLRRVNPPEPERSLLRNGQRAPTRMDTPKPLAAILMRKLQGQEPALLPLPGATATPTGTATPTATATPRPIITGRPKPIATAVPDPQPSVPPRGSIVVQAAAFSSAERANAAAQALGGQVQRAGNLYRVRIGPFVRQAEAAAALAKAKAAGYTDARIQPAN